MFAFQLVSFVLCSGTENREDDPTLFKVVPAVVSSTLPLFLSSSPLGLFPSSRPPSSLPYPYRSLKQMTFLALFLTLTSVRPCSSRTYSIPNPNQRSSLFAHSCPHLCTTPINSSLHHSLSSFDDGPWYAHESCSLSFSDHS